MINVQGDRTGLKSPQGNDEFGLVVRSGAAGLVYDL